MNNMNKTMKNKVAMVTGANSGIGFATARGLVERGAHVVMVCRDRGRCEEAMRAIRLATGNTSLEAMIADLSSQDSVRALAEEFKAQHERLDVLINNAALIPRRRELTVDGIEMQLAVNHLAPFQLTNLLLDVLMRSPPSRVIVVSSAMHKRGRIRLDDIQGERRYSAFGRYGDTKLMNVLFARAFARRLEGSGVSVNAVHPGFIATNLARDFNAVVRGVYGAFARPVERGARTPIHVATSPDVEGITGEYFSNERVATPSKAARDGDLAERLWRVSEELVGLSTDQLIVEGTVCAEAAIC